MEFSDYERDALSTLLLPPGLAPEEQQHLLAFGLLAQAGGIGRELKKRLRDADDYRLLADELELSLGHLLWYVTALGSQFGLRLEDIAGRNSRYNAKRWPLREDQSGTAALNFDEHFPSTQRFPRKFWAEFSDTAEDGLTKTVVNVYLDGPRVGAPMQFGDPIDDNASNEDFYRYHDVFHLAYAAVLGWSPVLRKLLTIKRKSDHEIDRVEDGARARDLEEATTAFIYKLAVAHDFFPTTQTIDTSVLDIIKILVADLEVGQRTQREWEDAVLQACGAQRDLIRHKGGCIEVDLDQRTIVFVR